MRTSVHIPDDLLARAKQKAAKDGRTLTSLIEEGLRIVLTERAPTEPSERRLPRVSTARGGLLPGIDPVKLNTLTQELDDIEMLDRIARQWEKK
jgi:hypothetical protein